MKQDILRRFLAAIAIILAQSLICSNIHLFGYATPLLCIYFVITFSRGYARWAILLWSFCLGLCVDAFANTPGLTSSTITLSAVLQPYILELFMSREHAEHFKPCLSTMGWLKYPLYAALQVLLFCIVFFSIEAFNFFDWQHWAFCIIGSALLTFTLILVIDNSRHA